MPESDLSPSASTPGAGAPPLRPPGPAPSASGNPPWLQRATGWLRRAHLGLVAVGLAIVLLGVAIAVAGALVGGDGEGTTPGAPIRDLEVGSALVRPDADAPEPAASEPGGRDQLLTLGALVAGCGVLVAGAARSAQRARARAAPGRSAPRR